MMSVTHGGYCRYIWRMKETYFVNQRFNHYLFNISHMYIKLYVSFTALEPQRGEARRCPDGGNADGALVFLGKFYTVL